MSNRVRLIPRKSPPLLLTESDEGFKALRARFWKTIKPTDEIEQMFCEEFIDLVWESLRFRRWKVAILNLAYRDALHEILVDRTYEFERGEKTAVYLDHWFADESVRHQISERLAKYGYDESTVEAAAFCRCSAELMQIEQLLAAFELRQVKKLQCIAMYRETLAQQLRDAAIEVAESETRPRIELKKDD